MIWIVALQRCLQDGLICHNNLANCNISWRLISATKYLIVTLQMFCYKVLQWNNKKTFSLGANCLICNGAKPWGLNLIWSCLDRDSWSWHRQTVHLKSGENLDIFKKFVSTVKKFWSKSRFLNLVSTSMSGPKSLIQEMRQDLEISSFLESLSQSGSRS